MKLLNNVYDEIGPHTGCLHAVTDSRAVPEHVDLPIYFLKINQFARHRHYSGDSFKPFYVHLAAFYLECFHKIGLIE